ncbi:MarR family transcriptional regulator [Lactococcus nasutitermitis]|uniref:MarR family transcriptional regulator n=1 Tax=Lactococcus nasutitermitis TaxID=1652957 RepID=A0ABV9JF64_9LACT|nr:MarR family transcriptional regulator [Lactococcus nasutitermitis]
MNLLNEKIAEQLQLWRNHREQATDERRWILTHLENSLSEKEAGSLSVVSFHILSALVTSEKTGVELAEILHVTRGGITRATRNLLKFSLITSFQSADDRKKIFYRLTEKGQKFATIHDQMHQEMTQLFEENLFDKYNETEKNLILKFLTDANKVEEKLNL